MAEGRHIPHSVAMQVSTVYRRSASEVTTL